MDLDRFDRQIGLFGREGQERLQGATVAVAGLGGLGSHLAQQLVYAGVQQFRLIDGDQVAVSNMNRLVGARLEDVRARGWKVDVARRVIHDVQPEADVRVLRDTFISQAGFELMRSADFVFGCLDDDAARLVLNEFCQAFERPYFDVATDIDPQRQGQLVFGGRIQYSTRGEMCVHCKGLLDPKEVADAFETEGQNRERKAVYGVPRVLLDRRSPSVVSLNGIVASVAVTEFLCEVTGLRPAVPLLVYHGIRGILVKDQDPPAPDCYYCKRVRGQGDAADWLRYIRDGWGARLAARRQAEAEVGRTPAGAERS